MDKVSDYESEDSRFETGGVVVLINFIKSCKIFSLLSKMYQFIRFYNHFLREHAVESTWDKIFINFKVLDGWRISYWK